MAGIPTILLAKWSKPGSTATCLCSELQPLRRQELRNGQIRFQARGCLLHIIIDGGCCASLLGVLHSRPVVCHFGEKADKS